jgi:hypothetical protein
MCDQVVSRSLHWLSMAIKTVLQVHVMVNLAKQSFLNYHDQEPMKGNE